MLTRASPSRAPTAGGAGAPTKVEPMLRRSADLVLTTTAPTAQIADALLRQISEL